MMDLFDNIAPERKGQTFNEIDEYQIEYQIPDTQASLHYIFRGNIRIHKTDLTDVVTVLTPCFIYIFKVIPTSKARLNVKRQSEDIQKWNSLKKVIFGRETFLLLTESVSLNRIRHIDIKEGMFVLFKLSTPLSQICENFTLLGPNTTEFAKYVYRNIYFVYINHNPVQYQDPIINSMKNPTLVNEQLSTAQSSEVSNTAIFESLDSFPDYTSDPPNIFPPIPIHLSKSQQFQFTYFSLCAEMGTEFSQDFVRYIHSLIVSRSAIIDLTQLPFLNKQKNNKKAQMLVEKNLFPLLRALNLNHLISGLCAANCSYPHLLKFIIPTISSTNDIKLIHFENCGITNGLKEIAQALKSKRGFSPQYWNLSNNNLKDAHSLAQILNSTLSPLFYLNLNNCNIDPQSAATIFQVLKSNPKLNCVRHLHIANIGIIDSTYNIYEQFIRSATSLETLDISGSSDNCIFIFHALNKNKKNCPIKTLILSKANISTNNTLDELLFYIKDSDTLNELDISGTPISAEQIACIINTIALNPKLNKFKLNLSNLHLTGGAFLPIIRAFLANNMNIWQSLDFSDNQMTSKDLQNMLPIFCRMQKLEELSLSRNFTSDIDNLYENLCKLMNIPSLNSLIIEGSPKNINLKIGKPLLDFLKKFSLPINPADKLSKYSRSKIEKSHSPTKNFEKFKKLCFRYNGLGNSAVSVIINIIQTSEELETLQIDGNKITSPDAISNIIDSIKLRHSLINFDFPISDAKDIAEMSHGKGRPLVVRRLSELQATLTQIINRHRVEDGLTTALPFEASKEIIEFATQISKNQIMRKIRSDDFIPNELSVSSKNNIEIENEANFDQNIKNHSCACEAFQLPLPFQVMGSNVREGGTLKDLSRIPEIKNAADFYNTKCIKYQIEENIENDVYIPDEQNLQQMYNNNELDSIKETSINETIIKDYDNDNEDLIQQQQSQKSNQNKENLKVHSEKRESISKHSNVIDKSHKTSRHILNNESYSNELIEKPKSCRKHPRYEEEDFDEKPIKISKKNNLSDY